MSARSHASLSDTLVDEIIRLADGAGVRAIAIVGSAARGEATPWSDVDVDRLARAAVGLYRLTVRLLDDVLDAASRALIQRATAIVPPDRQT